MPNKKSSTILDHIHADRPFSPLDAGTLEENARRTFFDTKIDLFSEYQEKPQVIVGRRGSGKTAFLETAYFTNKADLIVPIKKAQALGQIVMTVNGIPTVGRYPEAIAELWDGLVMTTVLQFSVSKFDGLKITKDYLGKIGANQSTSADSISWALLNTLKETQKGKTISTIAELISSLHQVSFHDAKQELFEKLRKKKAKVLVLFDSLESEGYVFEDPDTVAALKGLLKWVGDNGTSRDPIQPRLSVPGEYYPQFLEISSNPLKDFAQCSILRWSPRDLISLAASRLRVSLNDTDPERASEFAELDFSDRKSSLSFLELWMPIKISSQDSDVEGSFPYILRHTQMIPRQLFLILNTIFASRENRALVTEADVYKGVAQATNMVVNEIFGAYNHRHPRASKVSQKVLSILPEIFPFGNLHTVFTRHVKREYEELDDFVEMLVEIGAIGKVIELSGRYIIAQFQYNYDRPLVLTTNDELCIHPVFRLMFPDTPGTTVSRVWPIGIDAEDS